MRATVVLSILLLLSCAVPELNAQPPEPLPYDLLFEVEWQDNEGIPTQALIRIDAQTLEPGVFYQSQNTLDVRPVSWTLSGERLAILQYPGQESRTDTVDVCVLNHSGAVETCFNGVFSAYGYDAYQRTGDLYPVTWSQDGRLVYFVKEQLNRLSLVEADIATNTVFRTLYEYPDAYDETVPALYWQPSLQYIAVYDNPRPMASDYLAPVYEHDVTTIHLLSGQAYELTANLPSEWKQAAFCPGFSPQGSFLTARTYADDQHPAFVITDPEGAPVYILENTRLAEHGLLWIKCPTWESTEKSFYFMAGSYDAGTIYAYRYTLATDELAEYYEFELDRQGQDQEYIPVGPLVVSPQGSHIVFGYTTTGPLIALAVLFPDKTTARFQDPFLHPRYPLWIPH